MFKYFKIISLFIISIMVLTTSPLKAQDLSRVEQTAKRDLLAALDVLKKLRNDIVAEKIPMAKRITAKENSILSLRNEAAKIQAAKDSNTIGLEDIRNDLKSWEDENNFIVSLLDEYARRFDSDINISERSAYRTELEQFNNLDLSQIGEDRLSVQMKLVDLGFSRLRNSLGGDQFESKTVVETGVLTAGNVVRFGPVAFFVDDANNVAGLIAKEDGDIPHLFTDHSDLSNVSDLIAGDTVYMPIDVSNGKAISIETDSDGLFDHIGKGGIWIIPILTFAGLSTIASIIKIIQIYKIKLPEKGSIYQLLKHIQNNEHALAIEKAASMPYPIGNMLEQGVKHVNESRELVEEVMYESVLDTQPKLEKYLPLIAISAATAPLLGLLGTVTGMINTFQLITLFGTGDAQSLSSGISEALITTEFGLIVAIPALIMHALLSRKVQSIMTDMEKCAIIFVNGIHVKRGEQ